MATTCLQVDWVLDISNNVLGEYKIYNLIGTGVEAQVYKAMNILTKQQCVLHIVTNQQKQLQRLNIHQIIKGISGTLQIQSAFQLTKSQNIPESNMLNILNSENVIVLVLDLLTGQKIDEYFYYYQVQEILGAMKQLCKIVQTLHKKCIFHCDIKPDNIFVQNDEIVLIDFGSAQDLSLKSNNLDDILEKKGSKSTFVHETTKLFSSKQKYNVAEKFDVYSIGCVLFFLLNDDYLTQPLKRVGETNRLLVQKFDKYVTDLLCGMLDGDQHTRYTIQQILDHPALNVAQAKHLYSFQLIRHCEQSKNIMMNSLSCRRAQSISKSSKIIKITKKAHRIIDDQNRDILSHKIGTPIRSLCISQIARMSTNKLKHILPYNKTANCFLRESQLILDIIQRQFWQQNAPFFKLSRTYSQSFVFSSLSSYDSQSNSQTSSSFYEITGGSEDDFVVKQVKLSSRSSFVQQDSTPKQLQKSTSLKVTMLNDVFDIEAATVEYEDEEEEFQVADPKFTEFL
ncbi:Kinase [Hexamita inflata]|uniref:Kinase n=1 Tax=Hexamita inflata TaxID=28002 RepID=A0ABP1KY93_9EUKA